MSYSVEAVERHVERVTDRLDAALMTGRMSQAEYDAVMRELDRRATVAFDRAEIWDRVRQRFE